MGHSRGSKGSRQQRVESQLQRVVAELISREVRDPRVGSVTITAVDIVPDMSVARVFFVPFGSAHTVDEVGEGLARAAGFLRGEVGRRLGLRHAPRLEFTFDDSIERGASLSSLIKEAVREDRDRAAGADEPPPAAGDDPAAPGSPAADRRAD
jgi:ribosome-binding factor A